MIAREKSIIADGHIFKIGKLNGRQSETIKETRQNIKKRWDILTLCLYTGNPGYNHNCKIFHVYTGNPGYRHNYKIFHVYTDNPGYRHNYKIFHVFTGNPGCRHNNKIFHVYTGNPG